MNHGEMDELFKVIIEHAVGNHQEIAMSIEYDSIEREWFSLLKQGVSLICEGYGHISFQIHLNCIKNSLMRTRQFSEKEELVLMIAEQAVYAFYQGKTEVILDLTQSFASDKFKCTYGEELMLLENMQRAESEEESPESHVNIHLVAYQEKNKMANGNPMNDLLNTLEFKIRCRKEEQTIEVVKLLLDSGQATHQIANILGIDKFYVEVVKRECENGRSYSEIVQILLNEGVLNIEDFQNVQDVCSHKVEFEQMDTFNAIINFQKNISLPYEENHIHLVRKYKEAANHILDAEYVKRIEACIEKYPEMSNHQIALFMLDFKGLPH